MDAPEPETTPFDAISVQSNKVFRIYQSYLDKATPYVTYRWIGTVILLCLFFLRIVLAQGWYIVAYCLGIYLLNLFLAFLQPKFDPSLTQDENLEDGESSLPTKQDQEFRPFIRRLPEFKFWHAATRAVVISFVCSWFTVFDLPVFWPVLVMYWIILFALTMRRQIQHMIKYRYIPFSVGKAKYGAK
ncbi:retention in endoplasmic reticulum protein 1 [Exophiala xenobiotica]|uniref:Protein RER1 n=1 Tax=Lithohypha guttulata TaxID=1690604 RepID=A0ABR0K3W4_9EURO|nr:retention in endoplasmic reticulum protein 1 [Lithohypha guttulata]KAK5317987.1 retention in endoplasmic reticulum protein 1 [Exophiala xenobiotica]